MDPNKKNPTNEQEEKTENLAESERKMRELGAATYVDAQASNINFATQNLLGDLGKEKTNDWQKKGPDLTSDASTKNPDIKLSPTNPDSQSGEEKTSFEARNSPSRAKRMFSKVEPSGSDAPPKKEMPLWSGIKKTIAAFSLPPALGLGTGLSLATPKFLVENPLISTAYGLGLSTFGGGLLYLLGRYNINRKTKNGITYPHDIGSGRTMWEGVKGTVQIPLAIASAPIKWTGKAAKWLWQNESVRSGTKTAVATAGALAAYSILSAEGSIAAAGTYPIGAFTLGLPVGVGLYAGYRLLKTLAGGKAGGGATDSHGNGHAAKHD